MAPRANLGSLLRLATRVATRSQARERAVSPRGTPPAALAVVHLPLAGLVAFVVTGCAIPSDEPSVDPRVRVLPAIPDMLVTPGTVELPRAAVDGLTVGDIVISQDGEGFLRAIDAVATSGDSLVLTTHDAELGDALIDADIATSLGGGKADTHQLPAIRFAITDRNLLDNPAITARIVDASIGFEPALDLDLQIADRQLASFEMVLRGRVTGSIDLEVVARDVEVGPEIRLWESPPAVFYQQVGPVPVVETVTTSVVLKLSAIARGQGRLRIDANAIATMAGGIRYTPDGGWDGVANFDVDVDGSIPIASASLDQVGVRAWLAVRADVRLYGVAGPYIAVGPQVTVVRDLGARKFDASAGFHAATGGAFKFFQLNLPALPSFELLDYLRPLVSPGT